MNTTPLAPRRGHGIDAARWVLSADGAFLVAVGALAMVLEAVGHFTGRGPLAHLWQSPFTIGGFEAHGLAVVVGALLLMHAGDLRRRTWHACGVVVHLLLGGANIAFWVSFEAFGVQTMGLVATALHIGLVAAHLLFLVRTDPR